jgi:predicted nucleic acid-binding protein
VLLRYLATDDPSRAWAAAGLIDGQRTLVISGVVVMEAVHGLRSIRLVTDADIVSGLIAFLSRRNVGLVDADKAYVVAALQRTLRVSARRIPDAIIAAAADQARCDWIATFDERFGSPRVPSRLL